MERIQTFYRGTGEWYYHGGTMNSISRRRFVGVMGGLSLVAAGAPVFGAEAKRYKVIGFIKPFQELDNERIADAVAEIGWDGIECPVRANGRITAERAADELPKLIEALKKRGKDVTIITTDITSVKTPRAEELLRTAVKLGIKNYRLGFFMYSEKRPIPEQVAENAAALREIAAMNKSIGITGGIQNHSGPDRFGTAVWDIWMAIKDLDPKYLGNYFDIGHATKEGGSSWPIEARLMEPHLVTVSVKDFVWEKKGEKTTSRWVPIGEGLVERSFFRWLRGTKFSGPISHHVEFPVGEGKEMVAKIKKDAARLREWLVG
jgi:sugar phosphate isomerase/epimerase